MEHVSPELVKWLIGACGGVIAFLAGVAGLIVQATYKLGHHTARTEAAAKTVEKIEKSVELIPVHETRIGTLENLVSRMHSDIKELLRGMDRSPSQWDSEE